uniref:Plant natriuretic peptide-like 12 n=1 Tax=Venturia pyrina TaxID=415593 RepID=A0A513ZSA5_9PEZI|nr:plant natriuretic peptide-like 12 [Venturia pyrina]
MKIPTTLFAISYFAHLGLCEGISFAAVYPPPYLPYKCKDVPIPTTFMFAAAGSQLWDNGGACGRFYELHCLSPLGPGTKCTGQNIIVKIIEGKVGYRAPMFSLSQTAGKKFYTGTGRVKIEWHEVGGQGW